MGRSGQADDTDCWHSVSGGGRQVAGSGEQGTGNRIRGAGDGGNTLRA